MFAHNSRPCPDPEKCGQERPTVPCLAERPVRIERVCDIPTVDPHVRHSWIISPTSDMRPATMHVSKHSASLTSFTPMAAEDTNLGYHFDSERLSTYYTRSPSKCLGTCVKCQPRYHRVGLAHPAMQSAYTRRCAKGEA